MKTSPTMVPVLLLLIAFGCFLAAPAVVAEGPWDGENNSGGSTLHGSTTTVHDGQGNTDDGSGVLCRAGDRHDGNDWLIDFFYRITIRLIFDYVVVPPSMNESPNAELAHPGSSTSGTELSHHAAK